MGKVALAACHLNPELVEQRDTTPSKHTVAEKKSDVMFSRLIELLTIRGTIDLFNTRIYCKFNLN